MLSGKQLYDKEYRKNNRCKINEYQRNYRKINKKRVDELRRKSAKKKYLENPEPAKAKQRKYNRKIKELVYSHYGGYKCACCGETIEKFLTIDHVNNDGKLHKENGLRLWGYRLYKWIVKNNYPQGFQVLCFNCNLGKATNKGVCPHKEISEC